MEEQSSFAMRGYRNEFSCVSKQFWQSLAPSHKTLDHTTQSMTKIGVVLLRSLDRSLVIKRKLIEKQSDREVSLGRSGLVC